MSRCVVSRLGLLACVMFAVAGPLNAVAAPTLRPDMVRSLESMQQRLSQGNEAAVASAARQAAERLEGGNAADRWARALFLQLAATAEVRQGNDARAAELFAVARGIDGVDLERRRQWLNREARLRLRAGQTQQGAELLARWLEQGQGNASDFWLMTQASASLERWDQAANWADRARRATSSPSAEQLSLAASIYQRAGRDEAALGALDELLARDSDDPQAWRRAAGLAQRLGHPGRAAAIWDAAWRRGVLTSDDDLRQLVRLHLAGGTPARAAERLAAALEQGQLEDSLDNARLLAEAWSAARDRDRALESWRAAAERSGEASDWQRLGELAYGWGRWRTAVEALGRARETGGSSPRNWLLEGVALLELGERQAARRAFEAARQAGSAQAEAWLSALDEMGANAGNRVGTRRPESAGQG